MGGVCLPYFGLELFIMFFMIFYVFYARKIEDTHVFNCVFSEQENVCLCVLNIVCFLNCEQKNSNECADIPAFCEGMSRLVDSALGHKLRLQNIQAASILAQVSHMRFRVLGL